MKNPIFILVENSYIDAYDNAEDAGLALEEIDIRDNLFKAFDAEGRLLKIEPDDGVGKITPAEDVPTHQEELLQLLKRSINYSRKLYVIPDDLPEDLETLVAIEYSLHKGKIQRIKKPSIFFNLKSYICRLFKK